MSSRFRREYTIKPDGLNLLEYSSFGEYRSSAHDFLSGAMLDGAVEGFDLTGPSYASTEAHVTWAQVARWCDSNLSGRMKGAAAVTLGSSAGDPMTAFFAEFRRVVQATGRRTGWSPFQFVEAWRSFVSSVATGYDGDLDEYQDDLSMRDRLERAVEAPSLVAWPLWTDLLEQVKAADKDFEAAVAGGPEVRRETDWWNARLPVKAGPGLCRDAEERYGARLDVVTSEAAKE